MRGIVPIADAETVHGGKAIGLRRLLELGLAVPKAIAIDGPNVIRLLHGDRAAKRKLAQSLRGFAGDVAVRSSALEEDGDKKSFAGAFETLLNVQRDLDAVVEAISAVSGSGNSDRVKHYAASSTAIIPVVIQDMVDAVRSGVIFSRATGSDGNPCAYAEWTRGLGQSLVSGKGRPGTLILPWGISNAAIDLRQITATRELPPQRLLRSLARLAEAADRDDAALSWDIEWAQDRRGQLWALQMRPVTASIIADGEQSNSALGASRGIAVGNVRFVDDDTHHLLKPNEVLVARITEVNYIPAMQRASAIVTEEGGLLSHAAIVARELGKPCVVGAASALTVLQEGQPAEVNGTLGVVRQGGIKLGSDHQRHEIDWTAVYLYDKGFEIKVNGVPLFLEASPTGLIAYIDDETSNAVKEVVRANIRSLFRQDVRVVVGDKRIWFREWCRFDRLSSIGLIDSQFRSAIAGWDPSKFASALTVLKAAASVVAQRKKGAVAAAEMLFWSEMGAALHALVAVEVEGRAIWAAYRDTQDWRLHNAVPFSDIVVAQNESGLRAMPGDICKIRFLLDECGEARNTAYEYFSTLGAFDGLYFSQRPELVKAACAELGRDFRDEDSSLSLLYQEACFREWDTFFAKDVTNLIGQC